MLPTSTETKIEQGEGYLAIGMDADPGFPLTTALDHLPKPAPAYSGQFKDLSMPLYSTVRATLVTFDRVTRR